MTINLAIDYLTIDIDDVNSIEAMKALYQYNYLYPRIIKQTRRGLHVYFPTLPHNFALRAFFGDDNKRIKIDMFKYFAKTSRYINILFTSTEI